jgi:tRNA-dihydrouridine synthase
MQETINQLRERLQGGFFLSAMHEYTDGAYCALRSSGAAMVQVGLYFAEPGSPEKEHVKYPQTFLPEETNDAAVFLEENVREARSEGDVVVCMNVGGLELEPVLQASRQFLQAGGDLVELNIHGGFTRYIEAGRMRAMILPEHRDELYRWVDRLTNAGIPLIVKFNARENRRHLLDVLVEIGEYELFGVHINVRSEVVKQPDTGFIRKAKERYPGFLLASGHVRSAEHVRAAFEAGANMLGIAEPAMQDPSFIARLAREFR